MVIMREDIYGHGNHDSVVSISDVRLAILTMGQQQKIGEFSIQIVFSRLPHLASLFRAENTVQ